MTRKLNLVIVEDDPLIAFDIKGVVESDGHSVVGVFHSAEEALENFPTDVDLALLDVNLGDGNDGISLGGFIKEKHQTPCLFITSYYDDRTVQRANRVEPLAYILKPYEEQDILTNLKLASSKLQKSPITHENTPIFVKNGSKLTKIDPKEVDFVQAYDMYSHLFIKGKRLTASQTLKDLEKIFSTLDFVRVHRSYMVNLQSIDGICEDEILIAEQRVPVGRTYKKDLFDRIMTI